MKDIKNIVPVSEMTGEDDEETQLLHQMLINATKYILFFDWCVPIEKIYFGGGIGNIVAVFLFQFSKKINGLDDLLWLIEGDLPSAYFVTYIAGSPSKALHCYKLMSE